MYDTNRYTQNMTQNATDVARFNTIKKYGSYKINPTKTQRCCKNTFLFRSKEGKF